MCVYVCMCVYTVNVNMKILSVFTGYYKLAHTAKRQTATATDKMNHNAEQTDLCRKPNAQTLSYK